MNRKAFFKIAIFSLTLALLLSFVSLIFLNQFAARQGARFRDEFLSFFAASIERKIQDASLADIRKSGRSLFQDDRFRPRPRPRGERPPVDHFMDGPPAPPPNDMAFGPPPPRDGFPPSPEGLGPGGPPPDGGPRSRPPGGPGGPGGPGPNPEMMPQIWLVTEAGQILALKKEVSENLNWRWLPRPEKAGLVESKDEWLGFGTSYSVIKLNNKHGLYLVMTDPKKPFLGALLLTQAIVTCSMIIVAIIGSLGVLFFYLRRKSAEARSVLKRLESGDLKARFEIKRFDEFGELLLDFNRMADEIETLVGRIHATERKRKSLLQELGHDLRTPLTSLKTNFEILQNHHDRLSLEDKTNLYGVLSGEIDYFKDLIEKLITIASLDEPHYKSTTEEIQLGHLLAQEIQLRQRATDNRINWEFEVDPQARTLLGDSHLILRLVRNALDNAARYAENKVTVQLKQVNEKLQVHIFDDGPGLDEEAMKTFGERHEFRGRRMTKGGHFSLGLGSVIMKTIAELHHGTLSISNRQTQGAHLKIELPTV